MFLKKYLSTKEAVNIDFGKRVINRYINPFAD